MTGEKIVEYIGFATIAAILIFLIIAIIETTVDDNDKSKPV